MPGIRIPGSFEAYSHFAGIQPTGLIGAFFDTYFPIINLRASNQEWPILTGEKPAFLFPIRGQIVSEMTWSPQDVEKRLV
jgi:hypothetical protein